MAALKERLHADLTAGMRARDELGVATLRMTLSAVTRAEVAGKKQVELSDDQVVEVIRSEIAKRVEAAAIFARAGRDELASRERAEAAVLDPYLPPQLSDEALGGIVSAELAALSTVGATGPAAMGEAVKAVRARVGTQAAGARVAAAVKAALGL